MSEHAHDNGNKNRSYTPAVVGIFIVLVLYAVAALLGWPQQGLKYIQEAEHSHAEAPAENVAEPAAPVTEEVPAVEATQTTVEEVAAPVEEVAAPVEEAAAPVEEVAAPVEEVAAPVEEVAPAEEVAAPVEEVAPAEEVAAPAEEVAAPAEEPVASESTSAVYAEEVPAEAAPAEEHGEAHAKPELPAYFMVIPFALLLLAIAVLPLIPATEHWWESNLHRFYVAAGLGLITMLYYGFMYNGVLESHWHGFGPEHFCEATAGARMWTIFANAILNEFIPFIVLLFALFSIAGGIRVEGNLKAKPLTNTIFIAIGALLASFVGTTGAAMLLIRPLLETNRERKLKVHTVIFFIFAVCNCGGCLLPTGDPPLFLGYLNGVGFLWTMCLWPEWLFVNFLLLVVYFLWDSFYAYPREDKASLQLDSTTAGSLKFSGLWPNLPLLLGVILAVALLDPTKAVPGTNWHAWMYLREIVQLALVFLSFVLGKTSVRVANRFGFGAIIEVAALFFGIFICMQVPLQILNEKGSQLGMGLEDSKAFYWSTGALSSVLDNAPTYVVFSTTAKALTADAEANGITDKDGNHQEVVTYAPGEPAPEPKAEIRAIETEADIYTLLLRAVSLGAVFMGAMTYIGNGPNFMVKAIAEEEGVKMPSFFGYMGYSCLVLLPILFVMTLLFL